MVLVTFGYVEIDVLSPGFRGCLTNFSVMGELQPLSTSDPDSFLRIVHFPSGAVGGCDLRILQVGTIFYWEDDKSC